MTRPTDAPKAYSGAETTREHRDAVSRMDYGNRVERALRAEWECPPGTSLASVCIANEIVVRCHRKGVAPADAAEELARDRGWRRKR